MDKQANPPQTVRETAAAVGVKNRRIAVANAVAGIEKGNFRFEPNRLGYIENQRQFRFGFGKAEGGGGFAFETAAEVEVDQFGIRKFRKRFFGNTAVKASVEGIGKETAQRKAAVGNGGKK